MLALGPFISVASSTKVWDAAVEQEPPTLALDQEVRRDCRNGVCSVPSNSKRSVYSGNGQECRFPGYTDKSMATRPSAYNAQVKLNYGDSQENIKIRRSKKCEVITKTTGVSTASEYLKDWTGNGKQCNSALFEISERSTKRKLRSSPESTEQQITKNKDSGPSPSKGNKLTQNLGVMC
ncbi:hypothetical protein J6590_037159 [Homalodisca vitripennis]|nr:hypothetical protein J6590_037159 [Homalodisca vitripennis]